MEMATSPSSMIASRTAMTAHRAKELVQVDMSSVQGRFGLQRMASRMTEAITQVTDAAMVVQITRMWARPGVR